MAFWLSACLPPQAVIGSDPGPLGFVLPLGSSQALESSSDASSLVLATARGSVKRLALSEVGSIRRNGLKVMTTSQDDRVVGAAVVPGGSGQDVAVMMSRRGRLVMFAVGEVAEQVGRVAGQRRGFRP